MTGTVSLPERRLSLLLGFVALPSVAWPTMLWSVIVVLGKCAVSVAFLWLPHTRAFLPKMTEVPGALKALPTSQHGRTGELSTGLPPWPPHSSSVALYRFDTGPLDVL